MPDSNGGYVPGSIVWVPWSMAHRTEEERETAPASDSFWRRLLRRRQPTVFQRCLAIHIMNTTDTTR